MLRRRMTLLQAVSLNTAMMVGIGPFVTIPLLVKVMGGPHALVLLAVGAVIAIADGLVWSELAAAFPGSGGTYHFFDAVYGPSRIGRLLKFLFVWQFLFSAPLELASGTLGLARYAAFFLPGLMTPLLSWRFAAGQTWTFAGWQALAMATMVILAALAYRRIEAAGRLMVVLCAGMAATVLWIIVAGCLRLDSHLLLDVPATAKNPDPRAAGAGLALVMYLYLGYYQICYLGDEVDTPERTIPRSILLSVIVVAVAYVLMGAAILGVMPWQEVAASSHIASDFMMRIHGTWAARSVTALIMWTAAAGTFAALLGYSRVPYAAARSGDFFSGLAKVHPTGDFPHRSLIAIAALATLACFAELETVIGALLTSRILIQFVGQVATVFYIRSIPELRARLRFRMWLYPLPAILSLVGWLFVFGMSDRAILGYGLGSIAVGVGVFFARERVLVTKE